MRAGLLRALRPKKRDIQQRPTAAATIIYRHRIAVWCFAILFFSTAKRGLSCAYLGVGSEAFFLFYRPFDPLSDLTSSSCYRSFGLLRHVISFDMVAIYLAGVCPRTRLVLCSSYAITSLWATFCNAPCTHTQAGWLWSVYYITYYLMLYSYLGNESLGHLS